MKLSKRETIMIMALIFVVLVAGFWFLLLSPARDALTASQNEYSTLKSADDASQKIIDSVTNLSGTRDTLKNNVAKIESSLLPELDTEVLSEHFAAIVEKNGLHFIMDISCDPVVTEQLQLADGTSSSDTVQWVRINMQISGTDGITEGGIPAVGYDNFMAAVKEIEAVKPDSIHVSKISMEDTGQGFQTFKVSVDVYAFKLHDRVSAIDPNELYISWNREPVATGGIFGVPYANIPKSEITLNFFRPFATVQVAGGTTQTAGNQTGTGLTPTP